jgi:hypothetical protein
MKSIRYICSALLGGAIAASLVVAADKSASQKPDAKAEEMMKKMEAAGTPGPAHKVLDALVGEWNAEVKMWMAPDAPPTINKGTAKSEWAMKGRFLKEEFTGEFMGQPFHGLSFIGYDNVKQKYSSVWIDDMSTTMVTSEGEADKGGKVITFEGSYACAMTGEKEKPAKQVYRLISRDKHIFEMHDPRLGANSKTMEITYTRK